MRQLTTAAPELHGTRQRRWAVAFPLRQERRGPSCSGGRQPPVRSEHLPRARPLALLVGFIRTGAQPCVACGRAENSARPLFSSKDRCPGAAYVTTVVSVVAALFDLSGMALLTSAYVAGRFWTERELGALLHKETLIPVLHEVTFEQVAEYSGILPDLAGFETARDSIEVIAQKIAAAVLPSEA